ncbi:MAG TPA: hypothetical protein VE989_07515 [Sphingomicrobium sp.]|nr:hypothetical protein [Sphingomicrobium sp.]
MASLALAAAAVPATAQTEMLGVNVPDDFAIGYQARNDLLDMKEVVQPPETVDNWTKLITLQLIYGGARRQSADAFYRRWQQDMRRACAGMTDTLVKGSVDGRPALRGALSCPSNPQTGKPENLVAVLVQGEVNLMMVQVAFRQPIGAADTALINRIVGSLKVCDQRALQSCSARRATGFVAK